MRFFLWRHNCIWRRLHLSSMKMFEGHLGIKWYTEKKMMSFVTWFRQSYCFFCFFLTFKNPLLWSGWTDQGETLKVWPPIHEQKVHTYDVISHMAWQPYWIYPKTYKKKSSSPERLDWSRGNFTQMFPKIISRLSSSSDGEYIF